MKDDQDLLKRVSRTLRERHDGQADPAALTRERILASVRKQNKRRSWWFKGSIPGGMLLLGTTAWAQATHQWPVVWRTIGDVFSLPLSSEGNSEQELAAARANPHSSATTRHAALSAAIVDSRSPDVSGEPSPDAGAGLDTAATDTAATDTEGQPAAVNAALDSAQAPTATDKNQLSANANQRRKKVSRSSVVDELTPPTSSSIAAEPEPKEPPSEPEIAAFRAANDLDIKQRNLGSALAAYRLYLRDYPGGRFVPEARYNAALILVKLGKREEARRELTPFASGKYGAHRQARAVKLLQALEQPETSN